MLSVDKDEATRREERDREAAAKRQQNLMPSWHLKSTITGDLTALGVKENARTEDTSRLPSSNDSILKGLGIVGSAAPPPQTNGIDIKPVAPTPQTQEADCKLRATTCPLLTERYADYDQYYATLAASTGPTPAVPTPRDDFADEEEDVKPSLEYLDSLNEHNKRSRSFDDVDGTFDSVKTPRLNGYESVYEMSPVGFPTVVPAEEEGALADEPMVNGTLFVLIAVCIFYLTCTPSCWKVYTPLRSDGGAPRTDDRGGIHGIL